MIINLKRKKRIIELKARLKYLDDCLDLFEDERKCQINISNVNVINKIIETLPKDKKRKFSLSLIKELKSKNIFITYFESNLIYDFLKIGNKKINIKNYFAYHKLINSH